MVHLDAASVVPLRAYQAADVELDRAEDVLRASEVGWLGAAAEDAGVDEAGRRRFRTDLGLPLAVTGHAFTVRKAATVEIGPVRREHGELQLDISWRSANLAPLFPVFAGQLTVRADKLVLEGVYAPPGGRLGIALDRALLGIAAQRTARWFLAVVAAALKSDTALEEARADGQSAGDRSRTEPINNVSPPQARKATS
jgi:hypothetical protein